MDLSNWRLHVDSHIIINWLPLEIISLWRHWISVCGIFSLMWSRQNDRLLADIFITENVNSSVQISLISKQQYFNIELDDGSAPISWRAIIYTNGKLIHAHIYTPFGHNELIYGTLRYVHCIYPSTCLYSLNEIEHPFYRVEKSFATTVGNTSRINWVVKMGHLYPNI